MKVRRVDFSPDEWLGGTVPLDNAERGLYITACALIYSAGGPISKEHLRAACRDHGHAFNRQFQRLVDLGKLEINEGQIINKRAINELKNAAKRSENASQNVAKRWNNNAMDEEVVLQRGNANHQPSTINHQLPPKSPNGGLRRNGRNHDPWGLDQMTEDEMCARFNRKDISPEERDALRYRILGH